MGLSPRAVRAATFAALGLFGALHWAVLTVPRDDAGMAEVLVVALAAGLLLHPLGRLPRRALRVAARTALVIVAVALVLLLSGVPRELLAPAEWGAMATGLGQGLEALPSIRVPYRGTDEWVRVVLPAGGGLLLLAGAQLALWPGGGRPIAAAVCLGALYAVPIVERGPGSPFLDGAVFALLLAAFLWADRLRRAEAGIAAGLVAVAVVAGALVAPRVDADRPWLDYEELAESLDAGRSAAFAWDHRYGPLDWPRDGSEMARIESRVSLYWKTAALEDFDGVGWRVAPRFDAGAPDTEFAPRHPEWVRELQVTVRGLRSQQFIGAGTTLRIDDSSRAVERSTPGTFVTERRRLRRGDTYLARVYVPRPRAAEMRVAGTAWPGFLRRQLAMTVETPGFNPRTGQPERQTTDLQFPAWGTAGIITSRADNGFFAIDALDVLRESPYWRMYQEAQRLRARSTDPYDFVRRVQARVRRGTTYSELPPRVPAGDAPLPHFLFEGREGYCQHFSGAMALLLRMGGVPARVAAGFSPGSRDRDRGEVVLRDLDAHSWVEVYFPGLGWATFDPTPADSPARSQLTDRRAEPPGPGELPTLPSPGDRSAEDIAGVAAQEEADEGRGWVVPAGAGAVLVLAAALAVLVVRRRRRAADGDEPAALAELRRALRRTGRASDAGMTLHRLEQGLAGSDAARTYLRALRLQRYGADAPPATAADRAALRRELGEGLGLAGRLRAWWALPPRAPRLRRRGA